MTDRRITRLWLVDIDGKNHQKLSHFDVNESNARWSPSGDRIAFTASTAQGSELFIYWVNTAKIARLSQLVSSPSSLSWSPDGRQIAFSMFVEGSELSIAKSVKKPKGAKWAESPRITTRLKHEADGSGKLKPGFSQFFVISSDGGPIKQVSSGDFQHRGTPQWSSDGSKLYYSGNRNENWEYDFRNSEIYELDIAKTSYNALTQRSGPDYGVVASPNGKKLAYLGFDDRQQTFQNTHIYVMNRDGSQSNCLSCTIDQSASKLQWAADGKSIYYTYDENGNTKIAQISLSGQSKTLAHNLGGTGIGRPYGGGAYDVSSNGTMAYTHTTPYHPAELAVMTKSSNDAKLINPLNTHLEKYKTLGKCEEIWYNSSVDNRKVQGWIVTPPDFDQDKKYPLLVENHGGPISNYGDRFSPEIQLYATAGFVVFYPNPRGSTSYGEEFANLLYHNYPGEDYNDVMDGVDAMIAKGYIDSDSLYVTGGSAGGIMTAWMIGKNNRFRAAAVVKPVMNWISKTLTADNYYGYAYSRYPGQPWENWHEYWKFSPISLVGNVETPTMVMVGMNDLRTPISEAKQLYHALKLRKIPTALVEIPGASHFISNRPSQLITKVEHIVAWFGRY